MLCWDISDISNPNFITRICCKNAIEDIFFTGSSFLNFTIGLASSFCN